MRSTRQIRATVRATDPSAFARPMAAAAPDFPISGRDRVYAAEQFSNTVSVIDAATNTVVGAPIAERIRAGGAGIHARR